MTINNQKSLNDELCNSKSKPAVWSLYIVQTRLGHWYTGITVDVARRLATHQAGKGAKKPQRERTAGAHSSATSWN